MTDRRMRIAENHLDRHALILRLMAHRAVLRAVLRTATVVLLSGACAPAALFAQAADWGTVHQSASWYAGFVDHALTPKTALWFDGQWRRMGAGASPQQLLLRPGIQRTIAPGVRIAAGYAYVATAPYGERPSATPLREHRGWQQLVLNHRAGPLAVTHRYRWEQRWLAPVIADGAGGETRTGRWGYQQRARYMARAQGAVPRVQIGNRPVLGFVWDELLMPIGHGDALARVAQNRIAAGIGIPISGRQRVEVSYMNLWNALPGARTNEVNHTFSVGWVWVSTK